MIGEHVGKPISTKYLDVTTAGDTTMRCRLCGDEVYRTPPQPCLDIDQMNVLLEHFLLQHQVSRQELGKDLEDAFEAGMRREQQERAQ